MAWFDILGGLAQGLGSGLGQVQQNIEGLRRSTQVDRELALRALQEQRAAEEQARLQLMQKYQAMEPGVEFDPTSPDYADLVKAVGPSAFVKGPSGRGVMKKVDPMRQKAELEVGEFQRQAPLREAELQSGLDSAKMLTQLREQFTAKHGPDWMKKILHMPLPERQMAAIALGKRPDTFLRPEESEQVLAAAQTAAAMAPLRQAQATNYGDQSVGRLRTDFNQYLQTPAGKLEMGKFLGDPEAHFRAWLQRQQGVGAVPSGLPTVKAITQVQ